MFSMINLFSVLVLCSGQNSNKGNADKDQYVTISNKTIYTGLNVTDLWAKQNISSLAKFLPQLISKDNITSLTKFLPQLRSSPPKQYDWRVNYKFNVVTEAESQNPCYTCWLFATLFMLESQYAIHTNGLLVSLSKQQVVDCRGSCYGGGGSPQKVFDYVKENGLQGTKSYGPYLGRDGTCHHDPKKNILGVIGDLQTFSGHEAFLQVLYHRGPILATMITPKSYAKGGIVRVKGDQCPDRNKISHAVLLVGYGVTRDGLKYWIVKNTYGTEFGVERGYFKIERGRNTLCIEEYGAIAKIKV